jgi:hypothetical protein
MNKYRWVTWFIILSLAAWAIQSISLRNCTRYSNDWDPRAFEALKPGDSLEKVVAELGIPLDMSVYDPPALPYTPVQPWSKESILEFGRPDVKLVMQYSMPQGGDGEFYRSVRVEFISGALQAKTDGVYHEFW